MQERSHELIVVDRPIPLRREAVGDGDVTDIEAGFADAGEDVGLAAVLGEVVVDGKGVDEGDDEAFLRQTAGEVDGGDNVAL